MKRKGILKGGFLKSTKLRDISPEHFIVSLDLRSATEVSISANKMGIGKIRKIILYPKFYHEGIDYQVEVKPDKQNAIFKILNFKKFKNKRVVIAIK